MLADDSLYAMAEAHQWKVLRPDATLELPEKGTSVVVSGVTWSRPDLVVLDELARRETFRVNMWLFNPTHWLPGEAMLPDCMSIGTTPVLAEYDGRKLTLLSQGRPSVLTRIGCLFPLKPS
jgi:hypothetical protein